MRGDLRLAGFATVPDVGWKVWVTQAHAEVQEDLYLTYGRLLIWTILALLATVTLAILVATYVSRPIAALRSTAVAIAAGDATRPVPQGGPQEVAGLAQAFEAMLRRLTAAQACAGIAARRDGARSWRSPRSSGEPWIFPRPSGASAASWRT